MVTNYKSNPNDKPSNHETVDRMLRCKKLHLISDTLLISSLLLFLVSFILLPIHYSYKLGIVGALFLWISVNVHDNAEKLDNY